MIWEINGFFLSFLFVSRAISSLITGYFSSSKYFRIYSADRLCYGRHLACSEGFKSDVETDLCAILVHGPYFDARASAGNGLSGPRSAPSAGRPGSLKMEAGQVLLARFSQSGIDHGLDRYKGLVNCASKVFSSV